MRNEREPGRIEEFLGRDQKLLIGGNWVPSASGELIDVIDPANEVVFSRVAAGGAEDVDRAVRAARSALEGPWSKLAPAQRTKIILKLADLMERDADEIGRLETLDVGQPLWLGMGGARGAPDVMRYYAGWATKIYGETIAPMQGGEWHAYTRREPVGVVGMIVPWNAPYSMSIPKLGAMLAAGCTVVIKPPEDASLTLVKLGELAAEAGLPEGVVNVVTGYGPVVGQALVDHPDVNKISFTGSTVTGRKVMQSAAGTMKRITLELGGKSPLIIMPDADLEKAAAAAANVMLLNSGQICSAGTRLFLHEDVHDRVIEDASRLAKTFKLGPGVDPETKMGPLISARQFDRVTGYIEQGRKEGAELVIGGNRHGDKGYFIEPTIFTKTRPGMKIVEDEIFGPVISAQTFREEDLAGIARRANETLYGLAAYIWTRDVGNAHKLAALINAGVVQVNAAAAPETTLPFGGYKQSGIGRERGRNGVEAYTEVKAVLMAL